MIGCLRSKLEHKLPVVKFSPVTGSFRGDPPDHAELHSGGGSPSLTLYPSVDLEGTADEVLTRPVIKFFEATDFRNLWRLCENRAKSSKS